MGAILEALSENIDQLLGRASGPLNFRLVVMPIMVTILAVRAHLKDVKAGRPIFLGAFFASPTERRRLLRSGLRDFGRVFVFACVLDATYQFLVFRSFHPLEMVIVAVVCAIVPYFLVRGPITRIVHLLRRRWSAEADTARVATKADSKDSEKEG